MERESPLFKTASHRQHLNSNQARTVSEVLVKQPGFFITICVLVLLGGKPVVGQSESKPDHPNILWIFVDDMSDWVGCYGDSLAETPHIDQLASDGIRFERAFMPSPVCSTTRSALITGAMQTTYGLHHHRTMIKLPLPSEIQTIGELFRDAGYITFNEAKDDYNFTRDRNLMYSTEFKRPRIRSHLKNDDLSWLKQLQGQRFFGQIQLAGGKTGGETGSKYPTESRLSADQVSVPPQYPDHPVIRNAIARHYEQIALTDSQVGSIVSALQRYDLLDDTIIFFFTDHGCPLPRSKQFLYDEGLRVPLIIRAGSNVSVIKTAGTVRSDLVSGIDITTTSLALAGLPIPDFMEGHDLFAANRTPREFVVSARDRCGIAVDRIRTIRTDRFRYLRNDKPDRALYQSQYRDQYATFRTLRQLNEQGELSPLQASYHDPSQRPGEELYDLTADPHELNNLAGDPEYQSELKRHRRLLAVWEKTTGDRGQLPESPASLKLVFKQAKGKCPAPEFDFLRVE